MQKNIQVIKTEIVKQGNTNGKDWTIYKVFCNGDNEMKEFTTFDSDFANANGQQMQVNVVFDEKYKQWKETSKKQEADNMKHEELMNAIRKVWDKIDKLEKDLAKYPDQEPNVPEEHLKEGELEIPIIDKPLDSDEQ